MNVELSTGRALIKQQQSVFYFVLFKYAHEHRHKTIQLARNSIEERIRSKKNRINREYNFSFSYNSII